jgi:branched-chain amino acid transport system permease protein
MSDIARAPETSDGRAGARALAPRRLGVVAAALVIAALPMALTGTYWQTNLILCAINVLLALGLDFILGYAGQLNLGHSAFYGIGAYASTLLAMNAGWPFWLAFACGVALSGLAGMILALFAVRLRGHYLAIASLGFAVITYQVLLNWISLTQGPLGIYGIPPPPSLALPGLPEISFGDPVALFYLVAGFALLTWLVLDRLVRSPAGEALAAIREDEISAAALGIDTTAWKALAFGIGAAVAGAAGGFYAPFVGTLVPDAFFITESFTILAMTVVGGAGTLTGPVCGAILLTLLPELLREAGDWRLVIYGVALTLAVMFMPGGLAQAARLLRKKLGGWSGGVSPPSAAKRAPAGQRAAALQDTRDEPRVPHGPRRRDAAAPEGALLPFRHPEQGGAMAAGGPALFSASGLSKSFGGVHAVRDVSFDIAAGSVFAIIGPNGAGKSTMLNLISGVYQPDSGSLSLDGRNLAGLPTHRRVRLGIARTFQKIRLFKQLSALDNVIAGFHVHHAMPAWQYLTQGAAFGRHQARCRAEAVELLAFAGLAEQCDARAGALSYGEQRMLELARALATRPRLLLIDEPAAGLNGAEVDRLLDRILAIRRNGVTVVVVEHNMELVMNVADRILVMDYGQRLFEGRPADVQKHPAVVAAYLGGELM